LNVRSAIGRWLAGGIALAALGCAELPAISSGCGNGVTDGLEDCDTFAADGQVCRPPGVDGACRYDCSPRDGGAPVCPSGAACGLDGICRFSRDTRQYQAWGEFLPPAPTVQLGDFDGDGRQDLLALGHASPLWQSLPRILFFDDSGTPRDIFDPQMPISSPAIVRLGPPGDRRQQVVFSTASGIGTLEATSDRVVLPVAYPFQVLPAGWTYRVLRVRGSAASPLHEGVVVFWGQPDTTVIIVTGLGTDVGVIAEPLPALAGQPVAANVIDGADSPCEEALLGFGSAVYLLDMCDAEGQWLATAKSSTVAALTGGHTLGPGIVAARVDLDNHIDLVLGDENGMPHVAFGRGDGTFVADPNDPEGTLGLAWPAVITCPGSAPLDTVFPLAVGDLNGDGRSDWVMPGGVLLTQSVTPDPTGQVVIEACAANGPFVGQWSLAIIADLNRDGLLDLVAGSSSEPDLDFLQGTGLDLMNRFGIGTEGPVTHLVTGDFNGDLLPDVALGERITASADEKLAIAFGSAFGAPSEPVDVAQFAAIRQLTAANYQGKDAIEEIGVVAQPGSDSGEELSVFVGNPGGHPIAPLGLVSVTEAAGLGDSGTPLASAVGVFQAGGYADVLAVGVDDRLRDGCSTLYRLWLVPGAGQTRLGAPIPSNCLPADLEPMREGELSLYVFTGDVDGNGADEAFLLTSYAGGTQVALYQVDFPPAGSIWKEQDAVHKVWTTPGQLVHSSVPKLVDLDGNGWLDLVLIVTGDLRVVWNQAEGFDFAGLTSIGLGGAPVRGFAVTLDRETTRFVAVTDAATYEIPTGAGIGRSLLGSEIPGVPGGEAVELGDMTGDGLPDLVIAVPGGVHILAEEPEQP
jgi:hypothetical protein